LALFGVSISRFGLICSSVRAHGWNIDVVETLKALRSSTP